MNFFNNLFGGGRGDMKGDNDCCNIIWLLLLLSSCGGCFNFGDIFNCETIKLLVLIYLLSNMCGGGHDLCGSRC